MWYPLFPGRHASCRRGVMMLHIEIASVDTCPVGALLVVANVYRQRPRRLRFVAVAATGSTKMQIRHPLLRRLPIPWPVVGPDIRICAAPHAVERRRPVTGQSPIPQVAGLQQPSRDRIPQTRHLQTPREQTLGMLIPALYQMRDRLPQLTLQLEHVR